VTSQIIARPKVSLAFFLDYNCGLVYIYEKNYKNIIRYNLNNQINIVLLWAGINPAADTVYGG